MKTYIERGSLVLEAEENLIFCNVAHVQHVVLKAIHDASASSVMFNLSRVKEMDSSGLQILIGLYKTCQERGVSLYMEGASGAVMRLLKLCKLDLLVEIKEAQIHG